MNLYDELGLGRNASEDEIKAAHRRMVKEHHPDIGGDKEKFQRVQLAFDTLKDKKRRKHYDETGQTADATNDEAVHALGSIVEGLLTEMLREGVPIETQDMRQVLLNVVQRNIEKTVGKQTDAERQLKKAGKLSKRWKRKRRAKGPDLIGDAIRRRERDLKEQIVRIKQATGIWNRAKRLLDSYEYVVDEVVQSSSSGPTWFTVHLG